MGDWATKSVTATHREIVNTRTGAVRRIPFASDKQWSYLQSLRKELGKAPLKHRPAAFQAAKAIDKLVAQKAKQTNQQAML